MTSVELAPTWVIGSVALTDYPYSVDRESSVDIGEPAMVVEGITSLLADGDLERVVRHGNRVYKLDIYIEGPTLGDLADAEAVLRSELQRTGLELAHDPGDGFSPVSVYEVQTASLTPARRDDFESHLMRRYTLTLTCGPWARSANLVTVDALVLGSTTPVTVNNADTVTGWTASLAQYITGAGPVSGPLTVTDQGSYLRAQGSGQQAEVTLRYAAPTPVAVTTAPYLLVEMSGDGPPAFRIVVGAGDYAATPIMARATTSGTTIYAIDCLALPIATTTINGLMATLGKSGNATVTLNVHDVSQSVALPQVTAKQITRVIKVGGTERTPASIHVESRNGTSPLGLTIVHTSPETGAGYSPPLRRWRTSGNTANSASDTFSGAYENIHANPVVFEVPTSSVPAGDYAYCVALASDTVGTFPITWTAQTRRTTAVNGEAEFSGITPVQFYSVNAWHFVALTPLTLPTMRGGNESFVRLTLDYAGANPPNIIYDDAWIFRLGDDCAVSVVNSVPPHLWLDAPGVTSPVPEVRVGTTASAVDSWNPGPSLFSTGSHILNPAGTALFTATREYDNPAASATFYRRYHSNAAT